MHRRTRQAGDEGRDPVGGDAIAVSVTVKIA